MPNLTQLKSRLEKLPEFIKEQGLQSNFREYCSVSASTLVRLNQACKDMRSIQEIAENPTFEGSVTSKINKAISKAKKLHKDISEDGSVVAKTATKNNLRDLNEAGESANSICLAHWNEAIQSTLNRWGDIAPVIEDLSPTGGKEFKRALEDLSRHQNSIPQDKAGIKKYIATDSAISTGISKLKLDGKFGKFLNNVIKGKATTSQLSDPEIKKVMDEHNLWDRFKVRLN
jgi:hypothetical protein